MLKWEGAGIETTMSEAGEVRWRHGLGFLSLWPLGQGELKWSMHFMHKGRAGAGGGCMGSPPAGRWAVGLWPEAE